MKKMNILTTAVLAVGAALIGAVPAHAGIDDCAWHRVRWRSQPLSEQSGSTANEPGIRACPVARDSGVRLVRHPTGSTLAAVRSADSRARVRLRRGRTRCGAVPRKNSPATMSIAPPGGVRRMFTTTDAARCRAVILRPNRSTLQRGGAVEDSSRALGFSRAKGYDLVRRAEFPCRVLRGGRSTRVVTHLLAPRARRRRAGVQRCPRRTLHAVVAPQRAEAPPEHPGGASSSHALSHTVPMSGVLAVAV